MRAIEARHDFVTTVAVPLSRWIDRDQATWWCETKWQHQGQQYRRRIDAVAKLVNFEFATDAAAGHFLRLFGNDAACPGGGNQDRL